MKLKLIALSLLAASCAPQLAERKAYKSMASITIHIQPVSPENIRIDSRFVENEFRKYSGLEPNKDYRFKLAELFNKEFKFIYVKWKNKFQNIDTSAVNIVNGLIAIDSVIDIGEISETKISIPISDIRPRHSPENSAELVLAVDSVCYGIGEHIISIPTAGLGVNHFGSVGGWSEWTAIFYVKAQYVLYDSKKGKVIRIGVVQAGLPYSKLEKKVRWNDLTKQAGYEILRNSPFYDYQADTLMYDLIPSPF